MWLISPLLLNLLIGIYIEPQLGQNGITALVHYPHTQAALAQTVEVDGYLVAERFELYLCGLELCNGFSELTDPDEQRRRFEDEQRIREVTSGYDLKSLSKNLVDALVLKARRETFTGPARPPEIAEDPNPQVTQEYTSGKVRTRGLHAWKYGRIEMRAKAPGGQGIWPAFWMMPNEDVYGPWALSGEIDIFEGFNIGAECDECDGGRQNRTVSALHFGGAWPDNRYVDQWTRFPGDALPSEDFHIYSVEWGEGLIRFLVNDRVHLTVTADQWDTASELGEGNPNAPFDQEFYVMMNLAIGGEKIENTNEGGIGEGSVPAQFEIDWVRVYQCASDPDTGRACME